MPATIEIAGVLVGVWLDSAGEVQISADLRAAENWLRRPDGTVAVRATTEDAHGSGPDGSAPVRGRVYPLRRTQDRRPGRGPGAGAG